MPRKKLGEILVQAGLINDVQLRAALAEHHKWGRPLGQMLIEMKLLDERTLVNMLSQQLNIPAVDLEVTSISAEAMKFLDAEFCLRHLCLPFRHVARGSFLDVAMADPTNIGTFDRIRVEARCNVRPFIAGPVVLERTIRQHYLGEPMGSNSSPENRPWLLTRPGEALYGTDSSANIRPIGPPTELSRTASAAPASGEELVRLREDLGQIRSLLERDEKVIRKLMGLLVEKGICTKEEILARLKEI